VKLTGFRAAPLGAAERMAKRRILYAVGSSFYHGAYPEGTAIRFESFTLWDSAAALLPKDVCQASG